MTGKIALANEHQNKCDKDAVLESTVDPRFGLPRTQSILNIYIYLSMYLSNHQEQIVLKK